MKICAAIKNILFTLVLTAGAMSFGGISYMQLYEIDQTELKIFHFALNKVSCKHPLNQKLRIITVQKHSQIYLQAL